MNKFKNISFTHNDDEIEIVDKIVFDSHLSWNEHVQHVSSNVFKRFGVIRRVKYYLPGDTVNLLVNAMVFPHFDYCSPVSSN